MQFGMIGWYVPLSVYPAGYGENPKVPLSFVALASQKSGMVLHFLCFYGHPTLSTWFTSEYQKSGKKLDMGKGCVRFKSLGTWLSTWSAAPLRASPWRSTGPITRRRGRSWARERTEQEGRRQVRGEAGETKRCDPVPYPDFRFQPFSSPS